MAALGCALDLRCLGSGAALGTLDLRYLGSGAALSKLDLTYMGSCATLSNLVHGMAVPVIGL